MLNKSLISANLENDHWFIINEYYLHWYEAFWGSLKQSYESLYSGQYHIIIESRVTIWALGWVKVRFFS